eukprot:jgi/Mesen1/10490/ME000083S10002
MLGKAIQAGTGWASGEQEQQSTVFESAKKVPVTNGQARGAVGDSTLKKDEEAQKGPVTEPLENNEALFLAAGVVLLWNLRDVILQELRLWFIRIPTFLFLGSRVLSKYVIEQSHRLTFLRDPSVILVRRCFRTLSEDMPLAPLVASLVLVAALLCTAETAGAKVEALGAQLNFVFMGLLLYATFLIKRQDYIVIVLVTTIISTLWGLVRKKYDVLTGITPAVAGLVALPGHYVLSVVVICAFGLLGRSRKSAPTPTELGRVLHLPVLHRGAGLLALVWAWRFWRKQFVMWLML